MLEGVMSARIMEVKYILILIDFHYLLIIINNQMQKFIAAVLAAAANG